MILRLHWAWESPGEPAQGGSPPLRSPLGVKVAGQGLDSASAQLWLAA